MSWIVLAPEGLQRGGLSTSTSPRRGTLVASASRPSSAAEASAGAATTADEIFSPPPVGGYFTAHTAAEVCELVLMWYEDALIIERRDANRRKAVLAAAASGSTEALPGPQLPTAVAYDDVDLVNFVETVLGAIVIMEPLPRTGGKGAPAATIRPAAPTPAPSSPSSSSDREGAPYAARGSAWLVATLQQYLAGEAAK